MPYNTTKCDTTQNNTIQYNTKQRNTTPNLTIQHNATQCNVIKLNALYHNPILKPIEDTKVTNHAGRFEKKSTKQDEIATYV